MCLPELGIKHGIITSLKAVFLVAWKTTKETVNLVLMCSVVFQPDGVEGVQYCKIFNSIRLKWLSLLFWWWFLLLGKEGQGMYLMNFNAEYLEAQTSDSFCLEEDLEGPP